MLKSARRLRGISYPKIFAPHQCLTAFANRGVENDGVESPALRQVGRLWTISLLGLNFFSLAVCLRCKSRIAVYFAPSLNQTAAEIRVRLMATRPIWFALWAGLALSNLPGTA